MPKPLDYRTPRAVTNPVDRWRVQSRATLLLLILLLPLPAALFYAGPAWAQVLSRLIVDGPMLVLWLGGACGLGLFVLRLSGFTHREMPVALHGSTAAALGLGIESLAVLGLGLAGWLNGIWAWALVIAGWVMGGYSLSASLRGTGVQAIGRWLKKPVTWHWLALLAIPFLTIALIAAMAPPGMLWTPEPHGYDVVEYHLQIPREWYEARRIVALSHNVFSYFPFNVEMHYLLAMYLRQGPWAAMYLAQLMHGAFIALTIIAVYGLSALIARPAVAVIATLLMLSVPWLTQLAAIAYDEGGFLLFGALAIGWAFLATFDSHHRLRRFTLAGAMAGFAAGSKLTGVPEVLVAVPIVSTAAALWLTLSRRDLAGRRLWLGIAFFCITGLLTYSPWLLRNVAWTRNPVFPELMPLLGKDHFNDAQVRRWELAHKPPLRQQSLGARIEALRDEVILGWQFGYLVVPLGFVAFGLSIRRPQAWFLFGLLLILIGFWLLFTHLQGRFFVLAAPIAALLVAQADWQRLSKFGFAERAIGRPGMTLAGAGLVCVFVAIAWWNTNANLFDKLYGPDSNGRAAVLGIDDLKWLSIGLPFDEEVPENVTLVLIGEARAFWYPVPMKRLRYRTVFDVKGDGQDFITAWAGNDANRAGTWLVINPSELRRLTESYRDLPAVPKEVLRDGAPYVLKR